MTITYSFIPGELAGWMWRKHMRESITSLAILFSIGVGVLWLGAGMEAYLGLLQIIWVLSSPMKSKVRISRAIDAEPDLLGPVTMEIDDSGLKFVVPNAKGEMAWSSIASLREEKDFFFASYSRAEQTSGLLVPKRAFASDEELVMFRKLLETGIRKDN